VIGIDPTTATTPRTVSGDDAVLGAERPGGEGGVAPGEGAWDDFVDTVAFSEDALRVSAAAAGADEGAG
jgi:hypothetical protein